MVLKGRGVGRGIGVYEFCPRRCSRHEQQTSDKGDRLHGSPKRYCAPRGKFFRVRRSITARYVAWTGKKASSKCLWKVEAPSNPSPGQFFDAEIETGLELRFQLGTAPRATHRTNRAAALRSDRAARRGEQGTSRIARPRRRLRRATERSTSGAAWPALGRSGQPSRSAVRP